MEFKVDLNHQELASAVAGEVLKILKPLLEKGTGEDIIFDVEGLAEYLRVPVSWVYNKNTLKELPHFKAGKYSRFRKRDVDRWVKSQTRTPVPPLKIVKK
jgi:excisionase family DNA binding protein